MRIKKQLTPVCYTTPFGQHPPGPCGVALSGPRYSRTCLGMVFGVTPKPSKEENNLWRINLYREIYHHRTREGGAP